MARCVVIDNTGEVINCVLANPATFTVEECTIVQSDDAQIGDSWDGETFTPPATEPAPIPVPEIISDRQFFQLLAQRVIITEEEALAAVMTGNIPLAMEALVAQLPLEQQFSAKMLICGATQFMRSHPLTEVIRALFVWTTEETDDFWRQAALL